MEALGYQTLIELYGCNVTKINDSNLVEKTLLEGANIANLTVVNSTLHNFSPIGVSGVVVIEESHIAIHTWPEHSYVALDFFTCNDAYNLKEAIEYIKNTFEAKTSSQKEITRGFFKSEKEKHSFEVGKYNTWATEIIKENPIIVEKIAISCQIEEQESKSCLMEALKYMDLVFFTKQKLTPSILVDNAWHEFILCSVAYEKFCNEKFGRFIHHHPGGRTTETKNNFRKTIKHYILNIGEPIEKYWGEFAKEEWDASQCGSCVSN